MQQPLLKGAQPLDRGGLLQRDAARQVRVKLHPHPFLLQTLYTRLNAPPGRVDPGVERRALQRIFQKVDCRLLPIGLLQRSDDPLRAGIAHLPLAQLASLDGRQLFAIPQEGAQHRVDKAGGAGGLHRAGELDALIDRGRIGHAVQKGQLI